MKKIFVFVLLALITFGLTNSVAKAGVFDNMGNIFAAVSNWNVTLKDLGVTNPGILPSNPFYFLKEWGRSITKAVTVDPVKKVGNELQNINEQAAEIKKMSDLSVVNNDSILKALQKYQDNVSALSVDLESLNQPNQNPNVDNLLNKLVDISLKHEEIFNQLKDKFKDQKDLIAALGGAETKIDQAVDVIPAYFDSPDQWKQRLSNILDNNLEDVTSTEIIILKNLRNAEVLAQLEDSLSLTVKDKMNELQSELIKKIEDGINTLSIDDRQKLFDPSFLDLLPGDDLARLKILEQIAADLGDSAIQSDIKAYKAEILNNKVGSGEITKDQVNGNLNDIQNLIDQVKAGFASSSAKSELKNQIETILNDANLSFNQAKKDLDNNNLADAWTEANSANDSVLKAMDLIQVGPEVNATSTPNQASGNKNETLCTMEYAPVCGSDNKTYSNSCFAKAAGVKDFGTGECSSNK